MEQLYANIHGSTLVPDFFGSVRELCACRLSFRYLDLIFLIDLGHL